MFLFDILLTDEHQGWWNFLVLVFKIYVLDVEDCDVVDGEAVFLGMVNQEKIEALKKLAIRQLFSLFLYHHHKISKCHSFLLILSKFFLHIFHKGFASISL